MNWTERHDSVTHPNQRIVVEKSGVASRQVEATKYVEFRYIAASSFTWDVCKFHEKHQISLVWGTIHCDLSKSIAYKLVIKQGWFSLFRG